MEATGICPLTQKAVQELLAARASQSEGHNGKERRRAPRWPFAGTVELWVPDNDGVEHYTLATCIDLSAEGLGIRCDEDLPIGLSLSVAIHQPEMSFHGTSIVRHRTATPKGDFILGLQFCFDDP